jgi:c(7)-type cytochrome triheme protein
MNKKLLLPLLIVLFVVSAASAVPPGQSLEFTKSPMGTVIFSGQVHKDAGVECSECHNPELFPKMKQGTVSISMAQIYDGKLCGSCHNGQRAFEAKSNCQRCHVKK